MNSLHFISWPSWLLSVRSCCTIIKRKEDMRCPNWLKRGCLNDISFTTISFFFFFLHWKHSTEFVVKRICVRLQSVYRRDLCCHKGKGNLFAVICKVSFWIDQPGIHFPSVGNTGPVQKDSCQENVIPSGSADGLFCVPNSCRSLHLTLSCPSATWDGQKVEGEKRHFLIFQKPNTSPLSSEEERSAWSSWHTRSMSGDVWILRIRGAVIEWALTTGLHLWWNASQHWVRKQEEQKKRIITSWLTTADVERKTLSAYLIPYTLDFLCINDSL